MRTGPLAQVAFLRQDSASSNADLGVYQLYPAQDNLIGRDPLCKIVLPSHLYAGVSRQHAKIRLEPGPYWQWQICDLNSSNGTYVNGSLLKGCQALNHGDRITLGQGGPRFVFEQAIDDVGAMAETASGLPDGIVMPLSGSGQPAALSSAIINSDEITLSQLFPIFSTGRDLTRKAYLIPGIVTVSFVVLLFVAVGNPIWFNLLLAAYLSGAAYFFVYQLCGKHKPWLLLVSCGGLTALMLVSPVLNLFLAVFRGLLPGAIPTSLEESNYLMLVVQMFFGAGLMEELLKALPVLLACWIGTRLRSPHREQIGVWEPLDGILLGTASAVGFTLVETLGQYVPAIVSDVALQAGGISGELLGLQLLIPRVLGSVAGHMAYSGYLGYFIGLSVIRPAKRWKILTVGYLTASTLHALWNATGIINLGVLALVGVLSYAFLGAAILKARALSPNRHQNFATNFSKSL